MQQETYTPIDIDTANEKQLIRFITPKRVAVLMGVATSAVYMISYRGKTTPERMLDLRKWARQYETELRNLERERAGQATKTVRAPRAPGVPRYRY